MAASDLRWKGLIFDIYDQFLENLWHQYFPANNADQKIKGNSKILNV